MMQQRLTLFRYMHLHISKGYKIAPHKHLHTRIRHSNNDRDLNSPWDMKLHRMTAPNIQDHKRKNPTRISHFRGNRLRKPHLHNLGLKSHPLQKHVVMAFLWRKWTNVEKTLVDAHE